MKRLALSLILAVSVTAPCRSETVDVKYRGPVDLSSFVCTPIERSSLVRRVCYENPNSYMIVNLNGTYYNYCNIDSKTVGTFLAAVSMGHYFNAAIKGHFDCTAGRVSTHLVADDQDRFVEIPGDHSTRTYDLSSVQTILPGRFTIVSTTIDSPDVMKLELKALATLQTYCSRPDGQYPPPADLFTLGPPEMPVKSIEVETNSKSRR